MSAADAVFVTPRISYGQSPSSMVVCRFLVLGRGRMTFKNLFRSGEEIQDATRSKSSSTREYTSLVVGQSSLTISIMTSFKVERTDE